MPNPPTREEINTEIAKVAGDAAYAQSPSAFGVTNQTTVGLLSYCDAIKNPPPSSAQKTVLTSFLENAIGNTQLNEDVNTVNSASLRDTGLTSSDLADLRTFTHKTRHLDKFNAIAGKMTEVNTHLQAGTDLDPSKRLSLAEYAMVADMSKVYPMLEKMNTAGMLEGSDKLQKMYADSKVAHQLITKLNTEYKREMQIEPGTIVFDNAQKKSAVKGMAMEFFDKVVDKLITKHGHASVLYVGKDQRNPAAVDEVRISHVNPRHETRAFDMGEFLYADIYKLYADIYKIDLEKLISPENQALIKEKYGDNWKTALANEFRAVERELHDAHVKNLDGIHAAEQSQQTKAGLMTFTAKIGYKQTSKNDFSDLHQKMFSEHFKDNNCDMLCSSFVARTTIASLVELNQRVAAAVGVSPGKELIKVPIGKHENLNVMHPDRLLSVLKDKGCLVKVEGPAVIAKHVKKD